MKAAEKTKWVIEQARAVGFDLCGVAPASDFEELSHLPEWLARGYLDGASAMLYTKDLVPEILQIQKLVPRGALVFHGLDAGGNGGPILEKQIRQARAYGTGGITIWHGLHPAINTIDSVKRQFAAPAESPLYDGKSE